jgi:hypothetical protein
MKKSSSIKFALWVLLILFIIVFSLVDFPASFSRYIKGYDKLIHLILFFLFFLYTRFSFSKLTLFQVAEISFLFGFLIEVLQHFFSNGTRHFDRVDLLYNIFGISLGVIILMLYDYLHFKNLTAKE